MASPILPGEPFDEDRTREIVNTLRREGWVHIPGVLHSNEIAALIEVSDALLDDPDLQARVNPNLNDPRYVQIKAHSETGEELPFILRNTIELDPIFCDMLMREPILSLAETIVGENCRFCGQNVLRSAAGVAIDKWHCDGSVIFPVPDDVPRHDARIRPPVLWFTVQMSLSDIERIEHGPTQYVPGSHLSGRQPNSQEHPEFEGQGPVSAFSKAGDIYIQDPMCWHRGAPNTSDRTRYIFQSQYAINWAYQRFGSMNRVPVPDDQLTTASDRLLDLLGRHRPEAN